MVATKFEARLADIIVSNKWDITSPDFTDEEFIFKKEKSISVQIIQRGKKSNRKGGN